MKVNNLKFIQIQFAGEVALFAMDKDITENLSQLHGPWNIAAESQIKFRNKGRKNYVTTTFKFKNFIRETFACDNKYVAYVGSREWVNAFCNC